MNKLLFPIFVTPPPCSVPGLILTYSLNLLSLPITIEFFSPLYFKSCGGVPIDAKGKISFPEPIVVSPTIFTCEWIFVLLPIFTFGPIIE